MILFLSLLGLAYSKRIFFCNESKVNQWTAFPFLTARDVIAGEAISLKIQTTNGCNGAFVSKSTQILANMTDTRAVMFGIEKDAIENDPREQEVNPVSFSNDENGVISAVFIPTIAGKYSFRAFFGKSELFFKNPDDFYVNVHPRDISPANSSSSWGVFPLRKEVRIEVEPAKNFYGPGVADFNISLRDVYGNALPFDFCLNLTSTVTRSVSAEVLETNGNLFSVRIVPFSNETGNAVCTVSTWFKKLGEYDLRISHNGGIIAQQGLRVIHGRTAAVDMSKSTFFISDTGTDPTFGRVYLKFKINLTDEFDNKINEVRWRYFDLRVTEICTKNTRSINEHATVKRVGDGEYEAYYYLMILDRPCSDHSLEIKLVDGDLRNFLHKTMPIRGLFKRPKKRVNWASSYNQLRKKDYARPIPHENRRINITVKY